MMTERAEGSAALAPAPGLHWRIKDSFVRYVLSGPTGAYAVTDGAADDGEGNFYFPLESAMSNDDGAWTLRFGGDVRFSGHMGALFVRLAAITVRIAAGGGELSIDGGAGRRSRIAELSGGSPRPSGGMLLWPELFPALTADGVRLFGGAYRLGEQLDVLRIAAYV